MVLRTRQVTCTYAMLLVRALCSRLYWIQFLHFRSVVVVCQNLSASDIQKLIPACSANSKSRGPCMSMRTHLPSSSRGNKHLAPASSSSHGRGSNSLLSLLSSSGKPGETCQGQDVGCKLLKKIRKYLGERLKGKGGISRLMKEVLHSIRTFIPFSSLLFILRVL